MAVRIISPGIVPEERPLDARCNNCGCHFEFTAKDAKRVNDQRDGDFWSIGCPTCGQLVTRMARLPKDVAAMFDAEDRRRAARGTVW